MTTGQGSPTGNPVSPVIKVCGDPKTCDWMKCNIDIDASKIITGDQNINDVADLLWNKMIDTCNGNLTAAEVLGFEDIAIWRHMAFPFSLK
jgi:altronate dehydratase large subunit